MNRTDGSANQRELAKLRRMLDESVTENIAKMHGRFQMPPWRTLYIRCLRGLNKRKKQKLEPGCPRYSGQDHAPHHGRMAEAGSISLRTQIILTRSLASSSRPIELPAK